MTLAKPPLSPVTRCLPSPRPIRMGLGAGINGIKHGVVLHEPRPGAEPAAEQPTAEEIAAPHNLAAE